MDLQPTLEDEIILMRPLGISDFEPLYKIANDPLIWEQHPCPDRYKKGEYARFFEDSINSKGALIIIDKSSGEIIGSSRFKPVVNMPTAVEIGWSFLARKYWGGKYNKSMKQLMINNAFESIENIIFYVGKTNIRSQKAVEKIGGVKLLQAKYNHLIKDSEEDWTYLISKQDWKV